MNTFDDINDQTFQSLIGRKVVDNRGDTIGTLDALWTDEASGKVEFLGIKTGWLLGKIHVVPARSVEIHDDQVRVPYDAELVKNAPSHPAEEVLSDAREQEVIQYYQGRTAGATVTGAETAGAAGAAAIGAERTSATAIGTEAADTRAGAVTGERDITEQRRDQIGVTGTPRESATGEVEIPTEEERVRVGKREVEAGRVRLRKLVRTEQVNVPVELRREDVVIERVPADQVRAGQTGELTEQEVEVPIRREEAVVDKERVVTGAVRARKTEDVEQQTVSDSVRKTDVEVDRSGLGETARTGETTTTTGVTGTEAEREAERERRREERNL
ncbi:MAG: PRC and DUF2382 domain-containing protein [Verrucomicrobia bacterium]|nr:PRC and DUF2382 domain-containing protein [Verrucomicrobiota bacterium]